MPLVLYLPLHSDYHIETVNEEANIFFKIDSTLNLRIL